MAGINVSPGHGTAGRQPDAGAPARRDPGLFKRIFLARPATGMFGRMFPEDRSQPEDSILKKLADAKTDVPANPVNVDRNGGELKIDDGDNQHMPSGFTYLGQFIDHDITLDLTSLGTRQEDPNATRNFRTPRLDLDSLYGLGPGGSPYLYERTRAAPNTALGPPGPKFLLGKNRTMDVPAGEFQNDLPRNSQGCALIGDHRNDENLIVAQTHLAFLEIPQPGRHRADGQVHSAGPSVCRGAPHRDMALSMDRLVRLPGAADQARNRGHDPRERSQVLSIRNHALHAGRIFGRSLSPRSQHGARQIQPQPNYRQDRDQRDVANDRTVRSRHRRRRKQARRHTGNPGRAEHVDH